MKKCLIESIQVSEHEEGDPEAGDDADDDYICCIEEQTKTCNYHIMRHFFEQIEAYKKHVKQLEMLESEEQQGQIFFEPLNCHFHDHVTAISVEEKEQVYSSFDFCRIDN